MTTSQSMNVIDQLVPLADAHRAADEYVSGYYWSGNGKGTGCAVGCTVRDAMKLGLLPKGTDYGSHEKLAEATGLPEMLWRLTDHIFEGLPSAEQSAWTPRFLRAAAKCTNCSVVPARIMSRCANRLAQDAIRDDVRTVCLKVSALWRRRSEGDEPSEEEWNAARQQAYAARQADAAWQADAARQQADAAWQQAYAAWQQADAAWQAGAAWQADAAWQQAYAARRQADAAWQQAYAAWQQADAAWQAYAARRQFWVWLADVVCEELTK